MQNRKLVVLSFVVGLALTACGSSGSTPQSVATLGPAASGADVPLAIVGDDWIAYAHDQKRTGYQSQPVGLSASSVAHLAVRWTFRAADQIYASPLVYAGLVIVCTANDGIVYALDTTTGAIRWQRKLGGQIRLTPTIADGKIFVGTHLFTTDASGAYYPAPSAFYALDLVDGSIRWTTPLIGTARSAPVIGGGKVFIGIAGGDIPKCISGGVTALDEASGAVEWSWKVNPSDGQGGAVWAPLSYDGARVVVGTGNTCNSPVMTSNSVVALNPLDGSLEWTLLAQANSLEDDDTGGGALLSGSRAYAINKNGTFYAMDAVTGALAYAKTLNADTLGGWATPTTDGATLLISGGQYGAASAAGAAQTRRFFSVRRRGFAEDSYSGKLFAFDGGGNPKWTITTGTPIVSYAAIAGNLAFANIDGNLQALDLATGSKIWQYGLDGDSQGGPAVVPSGVYTASDSGVVYAFTIPKSATAAVRRQ